MRNADTKKTLSAQGRKTEMRDVYERRQDGVLAATGTGIMCNACAFYNLFDVMPQKIAFALFSFGAWPTAFAIFRTWRRWKEQDTELEKQPKDNAELLDDERMLEF